MLTRVYVGNNGDYHIISSDGRILCRACLTLLGLSERSTIDYRYCSVCQPYIKQEYEIRAEDRPLKWLYKAVRPTEHTDNAGTKNLCGVNLVSGEMSPKRGSYKRLPEQWIKEMHQGGMSARDIATHLLKTKGIEVSYRTILRLLNDQRMSEQLALPMSS